MTVEEKQALQTIILNELSRRQQDSPTLLIDALLYQQGPAFVYHCVHTVWGQHAQLQQMTGHLLQVLQREGAGPGPVAVPQPETGGQPWPRSPADEDAA